MNVLFLREHNRVARLLEAALPGWGDARLFETARNILIVLLLKIVIEEYINHIAPYHFEFRLPTPPAFGKREPWYRTNWMAVEFNLLYRWHSVVPSLLAARGGPRDHRRDALARRPRDATGARALLRRGIATASRPASACSTPTPALLEVERSSLAGAAVGLAQLQRLPRQLRLPAGHRV